MPRRCCDTSFGADLRQIVAEKVAAENRAGRALERALCSLKHHHMIRFAAGLEDPRDHARQKHPADRGGIGGVLGAEILREERRNPPDAVPLEFAQIVPDGMIAAFGGADIDGLVHHVLAKTG